MKKARGKEGEGRPVPYPHHSRPRTLPDSIFSQRGAHFSCGTDHEGEGGRETAGQDRQDSSSAAAERKREGQKATLSNRVARSVGRSVVFKQVIFTFLLHNPSI